LHINGIVSYNVADLMDKEICPVFSQFSFLKWSMDAEEESVELDGPVLPTEDDEFAFDVNAIPEPVPAEENEEAGDHFEGRVLYLPKAETHCEFL
jgi:hypothetical protein